MSEKEKKLISARKKLQLYQAKERNGLKNTNSQFAHNNNDQNEKSSFNNETILNSQKKNVIINLEKSELKDEKIDNNLNALELLVAEKSNLCAKLAEFERKYEETQHNFQESNTKLSSSERKFNLLETEFEDIKKKNADLINSLEKVEMQLKVKNDELNKISKNSLEQNFCIEQLEKALNKQNEKIIDLEHKLKEKDNELEMSKVRVDQISNLNNSNSQLDVLTQTNFLYEQQIRDLQVMVQQLRSDSDQTNLQYQSYVQQLNKEIASLTEKSINLSNKNKEISGNEQFLLSQIENLEKQLQEYIVKTETFKHFVEKGKHTDCGHIEEIKKLQEELNTANFYKTELNNKLQKETENSLKLQEIIKDKDEKLNDFMEKIEYYSAGQINESKLLATIESDKVAASRAVAQNEQLKKLVEEFQQKLLQLTDEKVELTNLLHSEQHKHREVCNKFDEHNNIITNLSEKLHFKDEEMIRLSHENSQLEAKILELNKKIQSSQEYKTNIVSQNLNSNEEIETNLNPVEFACDNLENGSNNEDKQITNLKLNENDIQEDYSKQKHIPNEEAMHKLEERFKKLMNEVASLTDEKQKLEHLVLQLQGETETIGEYITLYQKQRRILKQRENEKNTELKLLMSERDEIREKLTYLNNLFNTLVGIPNQNNNSTINENKCDNVIKAKNESNSDVEIVNTNIENLHNLPESNDIIMKIRDIITEMEKSNELYCNERIKNNIDHCACCSGKFETI